MSDHRSVDDSDGSVKKTHRKGSSTLTSSLTLSQCSILSLDQDVLTALVETLRIRQQSLGENHPKVGESFNFIGNYHFRRGQYALACENYRHAILCFQSSFTGHIQMRSAAVVTLTNLGISLWVQGLLDESIKVLEEALKTFSQSYPQGLEPFMTITQGRSNTCISWKVHNLLSRTEQYWDYSKPYQYPKLDHLDIGIVYYNLSIVQFLRGDYELSKKYMEYARLIWEKTNGPFHISTARAIDGLGKIHLAQGKVNDARLLHETAFRTKVQVMGMRHSSTLFSMSNLASVCMNQGDYDKALQLLQSVLRVQEERLLELNGRNLSNLIDVGNTLQKIGCVLHQLGNLDDGTKTFNEALSHYLSAGLEESDIRVKQIHEKLKKLVD